MEYRLLSDPEIIRRSFMERFVETYEEFSERHQEWIAGLRVEFNEEYYHKMFMWDRIFRNTCEISFADALERLREKRGEVLFLTEDAACGVREFSRLNSQTEFVAAADAGDLAACISYEWFGSFELAEQGCYLADALLPLDLYVFDRSFSWCVIFTHETDETEAADSRLCLVVETECAHCLPFSP